MKSKLPHAVFALTVLVVAGVCSVGQSQPPAAGRPTVFSALRVGQSVALREKSGFYELATLEDATSAGHRVVEIGADFVAVRDESGVTETRIPVTAVRAVVDVTIKSK